MLDLSKYKIRGFYNDISKDVIIGDDTMISGWIFIGKNVIIGKDCNITNYNEINSGCRIGNNVNMQPKSELTSDTIVEDNIFIGAGVQTADEMYFTGDTESIVRRPCYFEEGCLIGTRSILVSCRIGRNSVIGSGSQVLKDVPPNQVWIGNPAKFHMTRKEYDEKLDEKQKKKVLN